jgi:DNA replication and repair protein RecF
VPLARLSLTDFRNHADLRLEPGAGLVILTGENGAGKTNILEAVSLLAPGRGLRGATLSEMARHGGSGGFGVAASLSPLPLAGGAASQTRGGTADTRTPYEPAHPAADAAAPPAGGSGEVTLGTGTLASALERRQVRINAAPAAANALAEWLSVLWLTPAMDRLFLEAASGRRRFLDRLTLALSPAHAMHAARYEAAMRARNKLLAEEAPDRDWLSALEARMAEHGAAIEQARAAAVEALSAQLVQAPEGPFTRATIALEGAGPGDQAALAAALRSGRARDAAAGRTLTGPHRADLLVTHEGKHQPAALCSTGEQKALLLGLILAHAELVRTRTGRPLILLLDEVAAHLDPSRRGALWERLSATGSQVWLTGTEAGLFDGAPDASWYLVEGGTAASPA